MTDSKPPSPFASRAELALRPFAEGGTSIMAGVRLRFLVQRQRNHDIDFTFIVSAPAFALTPTATPMPAFKIPALKPPLSRRRRDELWKQTCLEIFIADVASEGYVEMNLAPSGDWNLYAFDSYRSGMRPLPYSPGDSADPLTEAGPLVDSARSADGREWSWRGSLRASGKCIAPELTRFLKAPSLVLGATAVLEYNDGTREYWALDHCGEKPDFHLRKSFRLALESEGP